MKCVSVCEMIKEGVCVCESLCVKEGDFLKNLYSYECVIVCLGFSVLSLSLVSALWCISSIKKLISHESQL